MKVFDIGMGVLAGICLMVVLLISSVEYVAYFKDGYYEEQYAKYDVSKDVGMDMENLLYVTDEMMQYLKGDRANLVVEAEIDGRMQEFFNEKEKSHMVDVQGLFIGGVRLRIGALLAAGAIGIFLLLRKKGHALARGIQWGTGGFLGAMALLAILMATNFNKYFTQFHLLFFDNDNWILNPETDRLINIVPEGFFRDTAFLIAGIFLALAALVFLGAGLIKKRLKTGE